MEAKQLGTQIRPQRIDIVHQQVPKLRPLLEQRYEDAVPQHIRRLVPMPGRMQALHRNIVGVVAAFSGLPGPADQRGVQAFANLLLLFVEGLLRHFFPREPQIARHGNQPQPDAFAFRKQ